MVKVHLEIFNVRGVKSCLPTILAFKAIMDARVKKWFPPPPQSLIKDYIIKFSLIIGVPQEMIFNL